MAVELWTNNAKSTLASGITGGDLSLTVASGHGARFPSPTGGDYFFATLDDNASVEIVKCTARSTDTLTITRAQQGTSGTAFSTGTKVEIRVTKQSLSDLQLTVKEVDGSPLVSGVKTIRVSNGTLTDDGSSQVTIDGAPVGADYWVETANSSLSAEVVVGTTGIHTAAYASRNAAAKAGRLFLPNNGFYVERDTGSVWAPWGPIYQFTAPDDSAFSWINQGTATTTTTNGGVFLSAPSNGSAQAVRLRAKSLPSAPYTIVVCVQPLLHYTQFSHALIGLRDTGTDDAVFFTVANDGSTLQFALAKWNSNTSGAVATYIALQGGNMMPFPLLWLKIEDNNTNRIFSWSHNGQNWAELHSVSRTDFVTPNQFAWGVNPHSQITGSTLLSYKES